MHNNEPDTDQVHPKLYEYGKMGVEYDPGKTDKLEQGLTLIKQE